MDLERTHNGRFAPGNTGGPGRPRAATEREYLALISESCPLPRWKQVVERAITDAIEGDPKARDWLSRYLVADATAWASDPWPTNKEQLIETLRKRVADLGAAGQGRL